MITPLFDFLATKLSLTKGTDFHRGYFPTGEAGNGTAILDRVGGRADPYNTNFRIKRFQFLTRNEAYGAGDTEANRIFDIVIKLRGETLSGWYLYDVSGNEPAYIGQDAKGRHVFSSNVTVSARKD